MSISNNTHPIGVSLFRDLFAGIIVAAPDVDLPNLCVESSTTSIWEVAVHNIFQFSLGLAECFETNTFGLLLTQSHQVYQSAGVRVCLFHIRASIVDVYLELVDTCGSRIALISDSHWW